MALRTRPVSSLRPGDRFEMRDPSYGTVRGEILRVPTTGGYVQVRIYRNEKTRQIMAGASETLPPKCAVLEWAATSSVYKGWSSKPGDRTMSEDGGEPGAASDNDTGDKLRGLARIEYAQDRDASDLDELPRPKRRDEGKEQTMARVLKLKANAAAKKANEKKNPAPVKRAANTAANPCKCGCGELANKSFRQGHDGRYYGWLSKVADGRLKFEELASPIRKDLKDVAGVKAAVKAHKQVKAKNKAERE